MIIYIMNALGNNPSYNALQLMTSGMLENTSLTSLNVKHKVLQEEDLIAFQEKDNAPPENTTLTAVTNKQERPICTNCKQPDHHTEFCIKVGGQMVGKTLDKVCTAQSAAHTLQKAHNNHGHMTLATSQANTTSTSTSVLINSKCYVLDNTAQMTTETNSTLAALTREDYDQDKYIAVLTTADNPIASVNWCSHSCTADDIIHTLVTYSIGQLPVAYPKELPFILDTGTTCHISPEIFDFKVLKNIPNHPIKDLGDSAVYTTGIFFFFFSKSIYIPG